MTTATVTALRPVELDGDEDTKVAARLMRRDLRAAAESLSISEVRYLVDLYYSMQDFRIQGGNQVAALTKSAEPHLGISYTADQMKLLEADIRAMLDRYTAKEPSGLGAWSREIVGIGPVIAAGLMAHIDVSREPTVGHLWAFAGLDPTKEWASGAKRPWNAKLRTLCWKIGESFVKVSNNPRDIYGHYYAERKERETRLNEQLAFAEQARAKLKKFKIGKDTEAYKWYSQDKLPPAHLHARAKRWAVKLFLAHWHEEARTRAGLPIVLPYPLVYSGHAHKIERPNPGGSGEILGEG